jgi:hypothetical protein
MDDEAQVVARMKSLLQRMLVPLQWQDLRLDPEPRSLNGFLTRASGEAAPWEFRFEQAVEGLAPGALLWRDGQEERWKVQRLIPPTPDAPWLAVRVEPLKASDAATPPTDLAGLLDAVAAELERSTLAALEREDGAEALARLRRLAEHPQPALVLARVDERLKLLKARLGACPQCAQSSRGLLLRLEAAFKRTRKD